jgi:anthranilate/para-aminobenzoate synthase component I
VNSNPGLVCPIEARPADLRRLELAAQIEPHLRASTGTAPPRPGLPASLDALELEEDDPQRFRLAVETALEHIRAGDVYQTNLSRGWQLRWCARLPRPAVSRWRCGRSSALSCAACVRLS